MWADTEGEVRLAGVVCFVFKMKTNFLKNRKPLNRDLNIAMQLGMILADAENLFEKMHYVAGRFQKRKSSPPCRTAVLCITSVTVTLFGLFMALV